MRKIIKFFKKQTEGMTKIHKVLAYSLIILIVLSLSIFIVDYLDIGCIFLAMIGVILMTANIVMIFEKPHKLDDNDRNF